MKELEGVDLDDLAEKNGEQNTKNPQIEDLTKANREETLPETEYRQSLGKILNGNDIKQLEMFLMKAHPQQFAPQTQDLQKVEIEVEQLGPSHKSFTQELMASIQKDLHLMPISGFKQNFKSSLESLESRTQEHAMEIEPFEKPESLIDIALEGHTNN